MCLYSISSFDFNLFTYIFMLDILSILCSGVQNLLLWAIHAMKHDKRDKKSFGDLHNKTSTARNMLRV